MVRRISPAPYFLVLSSYSSQFFFRFTSFFFLSYLHGITFDMALFKANFLSHLIRFNIADGNAHVTDALFSLFIFSHGFFFFAQFFFCSLFVLLSYEVYTFDSSVYLEISITLRNKEARKRTQNIGIRYQFSKLNVLTL